VEKEEEKSASGSSTVIIRHDSSDDRCAIIDTPQLYQEVCDDRIGIRELLVIPGIGEVKLSMYCI
jgi:hypothetical protein